LPFFAPQDAFLHPNWSHNMSHSEHNLSRIPKARRRRLTFAVTISAPTGKTLPQWQTLVHEAVKRELLAQDGIEASNDVVVKLLKTTTSYEASDE
jgi:hypothetical protein